MSACFSEVPIDQIDRLAARRGRYGIGFRRSFVQSKGGGRVWYAEEPQRSLVFDSFNHIYRTDTARTNPLRKLTPFIDDVSPAYDFTWEREWRVPGGLSFELSDVAFLVRPRVSGAGNEFLEHPTPGVPLLTSEAMDFWEEAFEALGGPEDRYVAAVLEKFADPNIYLMWSSLPTKKSSEMRSTAHWRSSLQFNTGSAHKRRDSTKTTLLIRRLPN